MTDQLVYDEQGLIASHDCAEPLGLGGRHMHGGFDADGTYVSPRTPGRWPAIEALTRKLAVDSDGMPLRDWPTGPHRRLLPKGRTDQVPARGGSAHPARPCAHPHRHHRGLRVAKTFSWAEQVEGDDRYCRDSAADASRLGGYIRADFHDLDTPGPSSTSRRAPKVGGPASY